MGEKGNGGMGEMMAMAESAPDPMAALEALPLDAIRSSPDTINAWFDTYLKYREVKELRKANEAAAEAAQAATDAAAIARAGSAESAAEEEKDAGSAPTA